MLVNVFVDLALDCTFEAEAECGLVQAQDDNFDWTFGTGTPSGGTGPSGDHTTGSGELSWSVVLAIVWWHEFGLIVVLV